MGDRFIPDDPVHGGCAGANDKASPPGRHQEQAPKQRCTFSPTTFSSVQLSATYHTDLYHTIPYHTIPYHTIPYRQCCTFSPTTFSSVQFSSEFVYYLVPPFWSIFVFVTLDARGCLAWTSLGIILFLRSLYSKFSSDNHIYNTKRFYRRLTSGYHTIPYITRHLPYHTYLHGIY